MASHIERVSAPSNRGQRLGALEHPKPLYLQAYESLRDAIVRGLLPPGMTVTEDRVARGLGISRTPARQALLRLAGEGLVELRVGTGFTVAELTYEDFAQMMDCRVPLELMIVRRACQEASPDELEEIVQIVSDTLSCVEQGQLETVYLLNTRFHDALVRASHNRHVARLYECLRPPMLLARRALLDTPVQKAAIAREHAAICHALRARDSGSAQSRMREHMNRDFARGSRRLKPSRQRPRRKMATQRLRSMMS